MALPKSFCVVEFTSEKNRPVETVPSGWIDVEKKFCWWPPGSIAQQTKDIKKRTPPKDSWKSCPILMLKDNIGKYSLRCTMIV